MTSGKHLQTGLYSGSLRSPPALPRVLVCLYLTLMVTLEAVNLQTAANSCDAASTECTDLTKGSSFKYHCNASPCASFAMKRTICESISQLESCCPTQEASECKRIISATCEGKSNTNNPDDTRRCVIICPDDLKINITTRTTGNANCKFKCSNSCPANPTTDPNSSGFSNSGDGGSDSSSLSPGTIAVVVICVILAVVLIVCIAVAADRRGVFKNCSWPKCFPRNAQNERNRISLPPFLAGHLRLSNPTVNSNETDNAHHTPESDYAELGPLPVNGHVYKDASSDSNNISSFEYSKAGQVVPTAPDTTLAFRGQPQSPEPFNQSNQQQSYHLAGNVDQNASANGPTFDPGNPNDAKGNTYFLLESEQGPNETDVLTNPPPVYSLQTSVEAEGTPHFGSSMPQEDRVPTYSLQTSVEEEGNPDVGFSMPQEDRAPTYSLQTSVYEAASRDNSTMKDVDPSMAYSLQTNTDQNVPYNNNLNAESRDEDPSNAYTLQTKVEENEPPCSDSRDIHYVDPPMAYSLQTNVSNTNTSCTSDEAFDVDPHNPILNGNLPLKLDSGNSDVNNDQGSGTHKGAYSHSELSTGMDDQPLVIDKECDAVHSENMEHSDQRFEPNSLPEPPNDNDSFGMEKGKFGIPNGTDGIEIMPHENAFEQNYHDVPRLSLNDSLADYDYPPSNPLNLDAHAHNQSDVVSASPSGMHVMNDFELETETDTYRLASPLPKSG